ncbi:hypothetical protein J7I93_00050 [Bacillus sp. ISL-47]|uniref:hypothetical protein n=1 Tax=Bacillus sp. ISL-47 TaxID=2819130 RepID=UPI001BECF6D2|nr:hypothetical protein [Bacillus sp. ISL-47]MBT2686566.1 hypothetical protein [Bacillus sp. ISL-47]MBT2706958.1 hypothetical protein [Pseudomonas sp. ISL-84]
MMGSKRYGCNDVSPDREGNCEGCVCSLLRRASRDQRFFILMKGTGEFLALGPGESPQATEFSFVRFNRETCCATFTFIEQGPPVPAPAVAPVPAGTLEFIVDCRCICALTPIPVQ